jgi:hypothetical protein
VIAASDARAEDGDFAVDGEAAGADPVLRLAAGGHAHAGQDLLQALGFTGGGARAGSGASRLGAGGFIARGERTPRLGTGAKGIRRLAVRTRPIATLRRCGALDAFADVASLWAIASG